MRKAFVQHPAKMRYLINVSFLSSAFSIRVATSPHTLVESLPLVLTSPAIKDCNSHLQIRKQRLRGFMWLTQGHEVREL